MDTALRSKGRVVFLLRLRPDCGPRFLDAYQAVRHQVADGVPGHLMDQVCQSAEDPDEWLITSEWVTLEHFLRWERDPAHRRLVRPMRECIATASSLRFVVREETSC